MLKFVCRYIPIMHAISRQFGTCMERGSRSSEREIFVSIYGITNTIGVNRVSGNIYCSLFCYNTSFVYETKYDDRLSGSLGKKFARKLWRLCAALAKAKAGWLDVRAMETFSSGVIYFFIFRFKKIFRMRIRRLVDGLARTSALASGPCMRSPAPC
jgi:hypothetical protein